VIVDVIVNLPSPFYRYRGRKGRRSTSDTDADNDPDAEGYVFLTFYDFINS
jgi:hypothetical protein